MEIRQLGVSDAESWWRLRLRALKDHPEAFGASYDDAVAQPFEHAIQQTRSALAKANVITLGAFGHDDLIGTVTCIREEGQKKRHKATINAMYVAPEARGYGVGRVLLTTIIAQARAWPGLELIRLGVVTENRAALHLYESLGFQSYGCEPHALKVGDRYFDEELLALTV